MITDLTAGEIAAFERDGFLVIPELVDRHALTSLRQAYDDVLDGVARRR